MQSDWPTPEDLIALAKKSPADLEKFRQQEIEKLISGAPLDMQRRLRGLQFQIDCKRQLHKSPLGACMALSKMMFDSVYKLNDALQGLHEDTPADNPQAAAVIPFVRAI